MTRSADDETMRVPAGCPKHPVHRPCLRRTPGRDSTLERRSPEVKSGGALRSNIASRSPLGERSARAFGIAIPWHDPATCGAAAMPRNRDAMPIRMSASKRSAIRHLAFCASEDRRFRSGWPPRVPFPKFGTEDHLASTTPALPEREEGRLRPHLSSCITREHHLASRLNPRRVRIALGRYEASSVKRAARRGLASSPTGARPIVSIRKARLCARRSSGRRRTPLGRPYVARGTKDTVSLAPACARAGPALHRR
jgi:hypothetical protein